MSRGCFHRRQAECLQSLFWDLSAARRLMNAKCGNGVPCLIKPLTPDKGNYCLYHPFIRIMLIRLWICQSILFGPALPENQITFARIVCDIVTRYDDANLWMIILNIYPNPSKIFLIMSSSNMVAIVCWFGVDNVNTSEGNTNCAQCVSRGWSSAAFWYSPHQEKWSEMWLDTRLGITLLWFSKW